MASGTNQLFVEVSRVEPSGEPGTDFDAFFTSTWPDLVAFCHTLTGSQHAAEEITQESLTRVYARYPQLADARPYAFRVAANLVRDTWRETNRRGLHETNVGPDAHTLSRAEEIRDAVSRLPARLRSVVILHYFADLPIAQIARQLHRPEGTIKRRLHEARHELASALGEQP